MRIPTLSRSKPMGHVEELRRENRALKDRFARLSGAVLRISSSLDLDTVLREAIDGARALTGSRKGIITTIDGHGRLADFLSSGFTPEVLQELVVWPEGPRFFEHLRNLSEPFRQADVPAYLTSLDLPVAPWFTKTMQGAPMHHRGEHLGHFFLGDKENDEAFTDEDEEIMVLFASQAAAAIANARTHRDVQRARADLEALVETSPVGVVVFDPGTGRIASVNREAHRMAEAIRTPGSPPEQLLEVMTGRREDGREFSLADIPLARHLENAKGVRAEEIELSVPDGRSVRMLINVTPLHAEDSGEVISVVVTMQDLAPFDELERQRADFLRLVSHELRAPLASIKGSAGSVLEASPPASRAEMVEFFRLINGQANHMRGLVANLLDAGSIEAGTLTVAPEPTSVTALVDRARTTFLSGGSRNPVLVDLPPDLPGAMADRERIEQVLNNLFSNAARHAPETSPIRVEAARDGMHVAISVSDEGPGIPPDELPRLFRKRPGLMGGTGLGLSICKGLVEAHGGRIRAESRGPGLGARFTFTLPVAADTVEAVHASGRVRAAPDGRARVLVVDDDPQMLRFVRDALGAAGFTPLATGDPRELSHLLETERPDLVLLDLILPGTDGIELMKRIPDLSDLPVIFISGYGNDETIAKALELGAADYIVKPFSPTELAARVRAALRRQAEPEIFALGELRISYDRRRVTLADRKLKLTAKEYDLLSVLSRNAGRVMTYEALLRQVWNRRGGGRPGPVRTYVRKLRHKLGDDAADPSYILTERAVGYRMAEPGTGENL